ncbi:hypothetical protein BJY04DRAFT_202495 [Aspergillus karnatakaensis]|uniref:uncharacterized protein n=1 Tax=Aspergillus karnatakaensis TaxID=1810916 RepID=UPI003CCE1E05
MWRLYQRSTRCEGRCYLVATRDHKPFGIVKKLEELVQSQDGRELSTSQILFNDVASCVSVLTLLREKIDPKNSRKSKAMRKFGLRALKWPLRRGELERTLQDLERYKSSFTLALQVDQNSYSLKTHQSSKRVEQKIDLEALPTADGAEFNSYTNQHKSKYLPGTRIELCRGILEWAVSLQGKCIFWLNGLAGTGKSTVSRTMARTFQQKGLLGASFFFKRGGGDRGNATKLFPTITAQLLDRNPELQPAVLRAIQKDPKISSKPLKEQFEKLLLQPLQGLGSAVHKSSILLIVIDAIDECDNDNDIRAILQLLPRVQESTYIQLRVFITSRPELPIRLGFRAMGTDHQDMILHEVPEPIIAQDISLFLEHKLGAIKQERTLPLDWRGIANFQTLVTMSVPLFIFAATVCRVLEDQIWIPCNVLPTSLNIRTRSRNWMQHIYQYATILSIGILRTDKSN